MDERRILLAFSIILTLPGTPVIYYGDEFAKGNDIEFYNEMIAHTGKDDTSYLVRGKIDWNKLEEELSDEKSLSNKVSRRLTWMLHARQKERIFGRGSIRFVKLNDKADAGLMAFTREYNTKKMLILHNMTDHSIAAVLPDEALAGEDILNQSISETIEAYGFRWIRL